jgi:hypothetical protein
MSTPRTTALATLVTTLGASALIAGGLVAASTTTGDATATAAAPTAASVPDPADFAAPKNNPYFPLKPGTVSRYRGAEDGERFRERLVITHDTKMIQGVETTVVSDVIRRADGSLAEKTEDWYAADNDGNVWYFGERTATYDEQGHLEDREGSWKAGRDGARAGTIMPANPHPTDAYRQEFLRGHAEDQAWIVQNHAAIRTSYRHFDQVVRSFEWTRLEPRVVSLKLYAPGFGIVKEKDVAGGNEEFVLVSVTHH